MSTTSLSTPRWRPLTGGAAVWIFMSLEVATFGMFLLWHAAGWATESAAYAAAQERLHPDSAAVGTAILLIGSWFAYQGVLAKEAGRLGAAARWLGAGALAGVAFSVNKIVEYASPDLAGIGLSSGPFWFTYLFLTGLHLLHVAFGVILLGWLAWQMHRGEPEPEAMTVEAGAAYWHLVDVIWVLLFPILYVMHP